MIKIYGLKNCDTCRKVLKKFDADNVPYTFVDFRKDGVDKDTAQRWLQLADLDVFINRRGTTWRGLDDSTKAKIEGGDVDAVCAHTSIIKRPVFDLDNNIINGFSESVYEQLKGL